MALFDRLNQNLFDSNSRILVFATKGSGSNEEARIIKLLRSFNVTAFSFSPKNKIGSFIDLLKQVAKTRPSLIVMEGTGLAGGLACVLLRWFLGVPYIFSSGDAIAPFISMKYPILGPLAAIYERVLCRFCSGFIGWTPYLVGRSLTFGAPRGITAPGWVHFSLSVEELAISRANIIL